MTTNSSSEANYKAYRAADAAATRAFLAYKKLRAIADAAWFKAAGLKKVKTKKQHAAEITEEIERDNADRPSRIDYLLNAR